MAITRITHRIPPGFVRILIALIAVMLTVWSQWMTSASYSFFGDEWLRDGFAKLQVTQKPDPRILIVDIDEVSLASEGVWPWPHARIADLMETLLTEYSAKGIALDIVLPKADDIAADARIGLMAQHGPVVLAQAFDYVHNRPEVLREGTLAGAITLYGNRGVAATGFIANHAGWQQAPKVGNLGFIPDADGALRRVPMITTFEGKAYPTLSLALVNCCTGKAALPLNENGLARVAFQRDWSAYTVVSAADILHHRIAPESAKNRLVIIGSSSLGLGDRVTTPLAASRPGLGVQAAMLSTLLDQQAGLTPQPWPGRVIACIFAILCAAIASFAFPRLSAAASVAALGLSSMAWVVLAYIISPHDPVFSTTGPIASNLFLLAVAIPYQWQLAQRRSRHLLHTLRQYVAPTVVDQLLLSGDEEPLKPRQLDVTTLIADMEGYTSQVESLPVEEAAKLTRDFLDCLTGPVIGKEGTLDKYTGDGLVAFWGAPLPIKDHADLALDAAREIVMRVKALSDARVLTGKPALRVRIGIDSGLAMAGDFGTSFRSIYTAVGDSVNTASRLEQAARDFSHDVIIGAGTVDRAKRYQFTSLGARLLRGKEKPTSLFTFQAEGQ